MKPLQTNFNLLTYLYERKEIVEDTLNKSIPRGNPTFIYDSIRYSLSAGGKRIRPILCLASCELAGGTMEMALPTACALEMIHTMSLIHDDLPAMDNDSYRRGKPTNHIIYGEDLAILAGDALLAYAFEFIATQTKNVPADLIVKVIAQVAHSVTTSGLVGGQIIDLSSEGKSDTTLETLNFIHIHKTGALLEAAVLSGALLAGAKEKDMNRFLRYAQNIGLAFQIIDDVLDIISTEEKLGKSIGKDLKTQKATYPSFWGVEESIKQAELLVEEAKEEILYFDNKAIPLIAIADFIVNRNN
uniref:Geranylgeranyl diphosphate synthase n=1 Tax=Cyanophora paradoxa TaxID=2762 RepID=CRTE_CYAPA|nr:prenyl transferase [Cyanophora paradoxa]P48368.1 RecName: Full=Geranylgeranyl diphosphate synthase; Short=GGPP synthase; AltName: Full=Farnesyltranstransferase [Cyanophora paradoxa]AAA81312.1 CrtE [Cyanophora paradoxa]